MDRIAIVGTGKMAEAIIAGLVDVYDNIEVVGRNQETLHILAHKYPIKTANLTNYSIDNKTIVLAIKPYALIEVAQQFQGKANILISILAGTALQALHTIPADSYARAMPNIAASQKASMTAIVGDEQAKKVASTIFNTIGKTLLLRSEKELDIATAIAGSGPAFLALIAEACIDGGVACGLQRKDATYLTQGLFESFAAISHEHPALIKDSVMSPGGTTAAGYTILENRATRSAFIDAIIHAFQKAQQWDK